MPEARDGAGVAALVLEGLVWVEQFGALNGVPCGAVRQTLLPVRRFEQFGRISGLNE